MGGHEEESLAKKGTETLPVPRERERGRAQGKQKADLMADNEDLYRAGKYISPDQGFENTGPREEKGGD